MHLNEASAASAADAHHGNETSSGKDLGRALAAKLNALEELDYQGLRDAWRRLYRVPPPAKVSRDLLLLGVGWRLQADVLGGLRPATKRRLASLAEAVERGGDVTRDRVARLKPGAKLIREWHGITHVVVVCEKGFEWQGKLWRSLTKIAWEITGAHWSGPRFFGLRGRVVSGGGTAHA